MKTFKIKLAAAILAAIIIAPLAALAGQDLPKPDDKPKEKPIPYTLKKCIVSGDKLGGDMGDPYVYIYTDKDHVAHEIKFCCKSCLKDFNKDPQGYLKKIAEAEAKEKKK
jgi:hypothetical protein